MKIVSLVLTLYLLAMQSASGAQEPAASVPAGPSAKILAIGRFNGRPTPEQLKILSLRWYGTGKIDQWFSPLDGNGVVLILNLLSVEEAQAMLAGTAGQRDLLTFELIPVEPLTPLSRLLPQPVKPAK